MEIIEEEYKDYTSFTVLIPNTEVKLPVYIHRNLNFDKGKHPEYCIHYRLDEKIIGIDNNEFLLQNPEILITYIRSIFDLNKFLYKHMDEIFIKNL